MTISLISHLDTSSAITLMENYFSLKDTIKNDLVFHAPADANKEFQVVCMDDAGSAIATVLASPEKHAGRVYSLVSSTAVMWIRVLSSVHCIDCCIQGTRAYTAHRLGHTTLVRLRPKRSTPDRPNTVARRLADAYTHICVHSL